jgi:type 1 glutamine amidotransferase
VALQVQDGSHAATKGMASPLEVFDEIYLFKSFERDKVKTLVALDKHPNEGTPGFYPLAWTRAHGKGRVFYTALGHREDVLEADWYRKHLLGGTLWALSLAP